MSIMRDFRDAKSMAHTLRESLTSKAMAISHSESLEMVSRMLGVADWNTLSALLKDDPRTAASIKTGASSYPAIPIRDFVPFPAMTFPLYVGREKTRQALELAFAGPREVVLAVQKDAAVDDPKQNDLYEVGTLARLMEVERLRDDTLKVLVQVQRRIAIRRFVGEHGAFQAEIADLAEGRPPEAPALIDQAVGRFGLNHLSTERDADPQPSEAFQRVIERAGMQAWEMQCAATTGAEILSAMFGEWRSPAVQVLVQQHMTQKRALAFIAERQTKRR
jgi:ATP-dependent Lon protease